jgi:hypothetical protein
MWLDNRTTQVSLQILESFSSVLSTAGPISEYCYSLVKSGRIRDLIDYEFDYSGEVSQKRRCDYQNARQIQAFYSKSDYLDLGYDRTGRALDKFIEAEDKCLRTNRKFSYLQRKPKYFSGSLHAILHSAQRKISRVLGELPEFSSLSPAFGPGANTTVLGHSSSARLKLSARISCSHELVPYLSGHLEDVPEWARVHATLESDDSWVVPVTVTPGKLVFVPKTAKIHRAIIVEPLLNSFVQKGVGSYIRSRLFAAGVDLRDQSFNQQLAKYGSLYNDVSTLDLSSASDTISREVVFSLLPLDWAQALDSLCTRHITYGDAEFHLEKFSSMGNGFTFELESLIFWALAKAVCAVKKIDSTLVNVYGDDIIVPKGADELLRFALTECGFTVNNSKSYSDGPFRESCGADYYNGIDIRPFYQREKISDRTLYTFHNWLVRHRPDSYLIDLCLMQIKGEKLYGPDGFGDGHLVSEYYQLRRNRSLARSGWDGGFFDTFTLKPVSNSLAGKGDRAFPTYSVYTRSGELDATDPNVVRGSRGYAKISIYKNR